MPTFSCTSEIIITHGDAGQIVVKRERLLWVPVGPQAIKITGIVVTGGLEEQLRRRGFSDVDIAAASALVAACLAAERGEGGQPE